MGKRCDDVHVICDAIAGGLGGEFASVVLGELSYNEWAKLGESLVTLGFGFPFLDGRVEGARTFDSASKRARQWCGSVGCQPSQDVVQSCCHV